MRTWGTDLAIGVRLAVGGGRTSAVRFALGAVGVGIAVAVLLLASSVGNALDARDARALAHSPVFAPVAGVDPTLVANTDTELRDRGVLVTHLLATGPSSPLPPGVPRAPGPDEVYLSPALAEMLAGPDGHLLRPRFPQRVVGVLDPATLPDPADAAAVTGMRGPDDFAWAQRAYGFGGAPAHDDPIDPGLLLLLLLGVVALLVPVFIFIAASTRIAGAERDRRLSALRLVGADHRQVRRIAAAETLVSSVAGIALGVGLFLGGRPLADGVRVMGVQVAPSDIVPDPWLAAAVVVAVPVLAVLTAQFALRRTIVEPLGVVRFSRPVHRRLGWRLAVLGAGAGLILWHGGVESNSQLWAYSIAAGATLVLVGVPVLLPWTVERVVSRLRGGPPSWQLAVRRLQLDSGTSARVIGGVAVVLAGAVALQAVLVSQAAAVGLGEPITRPAHEVRVFGSGADTGEITRAIAGVQGVVQVAAFRHIGVHVVGSGPGSSLSVADCVSIRAAYGVTDCVDGQVFAQSGTLVEPLVPGRAIELREDEDRGRSWTVPEAIRELPQVTDEAPFVATPGALPGEFPDAPFSVNVQTDGDADVAERVRNALWPISPDVNVHVDGASPAANADQEMYLTIRRGLLLGALFTLLLAGVSLLVLALEHIRERRRPLAVLAAGGVPLGAIARSLLWQIALPIGLGVVVAVVVGIGLAGLMMRLSVDQLLIDWVGVGVMAGMAAVLGLLVSVVTLPFLRSVARVESLRTE